MHLWLLWWELVLELRPACKRERTFLWLSASLAGMTVRRDLAGVTSLVRGLGLLERCYDCLLDFFHSPALDLERLTLLWKDLALRCCEPFLVTFNQRLVILGDGIKIPKSGFKMPAVKYLYQSSESNSKPEYINGHSCQAVALLLGGDESHFALPLASRIHEGLVFSNRDKLTLLDKMLILLRSLCIKRPCYFVADAYYASRGVIHGLLADGQHLVTRVRSNAVAYEIAPTSTNSHKRGRKKVYGKKVKLRHLAKDQAAMSEMQSPVYGEKNVILHYRTLDLLWRSVGIVVRFVIVDHPRRGLIFLMTTDLTLSAADIIQLYGLRFKIEVSFKQTLRTLGTYAYHFWMSNMVRRKKYGGDQYLFKTSDRYRADVIRKMGAYHRHIQIGLIAQGLAQYLSLRAPKQIWNLFGSWIRTIRPGILPSEQVVTTSLRNTLPQFLTDSSHNAILKKFLLKNIDFNRSEGIRMVA
jgi:hypothetical protein